MHIYLMFYYISGLGSGYITLPQRKGSPFPLDSLAIWGCQSPVTAQKMGGGRHYQVIFQNHLVEILKSRVNEGMPILHIREKQTG